MGTWVVCVCEGSRESVGGRRWGRGRSWVPPISPQAHPGLVTHVQPPHASTHLHHLGRVGEGPVRVSVGGHGAAGLRDGVRHVEERLGHVLDQLGGRHLFVYCVGVIGPSIVVGFTSEKAGRGRPVVDRYPARARVCVTYHDGGGGRPRALGPHCHHPHGLRAATRRLFGGRH